MRAVQLVAAQIVAAKKWPRKTGAISPKVLFEEQAREKIAALQTHNLQALESEVGDVAVTHRDASGGCEQAIDRRHQAGENSGGGSEGGGSGLGH